MKIFPIMIYILSILIIYSASTIQKNKKPIMWPIYFLRVFLPFFCMGLYGQIFLFLLTLFDCQKGKSYVNPNKVCRTGMNYIIHSPFVVLAIILHFIISFITNTLYYRTLFIVSKSDVLIKTNSFPEIILFLLKTIMVIIFATDKENESEYWQNIIILMLITGLNAIFVLQFQHRLNKKLMQLNIFYSLLLFFGYFTLFIIKVFMSLGYNGGFYLFIFWIIYIFGFIVLYKKNEIDFVVIDYKNINNVNSYIKYIMQYYRIVSSKNNSRNNLAILKSYLETIEKNNTNKDCPLQLYIKELEKGKEYEYLLYQYLDILYKFGLSKFKDDATLKTSYAMFLASKMNNKKQAMIVLNSISDRFLSLNINYNIYRCKKIINKSVSTINSFYLNYRNDIKEFKELILELSKLYYEFWVLLYEAKFQNSDNFEKINLIGSKIMILRKKVEDIYQSMIKTKTNNIEIYKLYSEYMKDILKDEDYEKKQNMDSIYSESIEHEEKDYTNYNMDNLKKNDLTNYLLISGRKKDLGTILDCSINTSKIFGYTKDELIGYHINILIPDLFHSKHNVILLEQSKKNSFNLFNHLFCRKEYNLDVITNNIFGVFKSKFIRPIRVKIYYIKTEKNIVAFLVNILKDTPYMSELINKITNESNIDSRCCILTNENLLINTFTPNSLEQLGLSYRYIKANNSIIPFIKQLHHDYLNAINDLSLIANNGNTHLNTRRELISLDDSSKFSETKINNKNNIITAEMKKKIKDDLINKKYNKKCQITWRLNNKYSKKIKVIKENEIGNENLTKCSRISNRGSSISILTSRKKDENSLEIEFLMEVKKAIIDNKLLGYYFYFSKLFPSETKNFIGYMASEDLNNNGENKKIIKYKTIIKPLQKVRVISQERRISDSGVSKYKISNISNKNSENNSKSSEKHSSFISKRIKIKENLENKTLMPFQLSKNNFDFEPKIKRQSKVTSALAENEVNTDEVIIDESFLPNSISNFSFDLQNMCYNFEKDNSKSKILKTILRKEATEKIRLYQEYLNSLKSKESDLSDESYSEDDYSSNSGEGSSDISDESSDKHKDIPNKKKKQLIINPNARIVNKSVSLKNVIKSKIENITPIKESNTLKMIKEDKEENQKELDKKRRSKLMPENYNSSSNVNSNISRQIKKSQGKNNTINFYKVNLNKIHFLIYDFNKDMFVEGDKKDISIKIENIMNNASKQNSIINIGKDDKNPFFLLKKNKEVKKNLNKQNESEKNLNDINSNISEEKSLSRKINEAINKKDDKEVKAFRIYMIITCVIMIILPIIILILNLFFYDKLKNILDLMKNIFNVQCCLDYSIYCVRELTLINFNVSNINGGIYTKYPSNDLETYRQLIKNRLVGYFIENQECFKKILSTQYSFSKSFIKNFTTTVLDSAYKLEKGVGHMKGNILETLMQYNAIFYSISSSFAPLYQNHSDIFSFLHNSFNDFGRAIKICKENYHNELILEKFSIIIYFIVICVIILIIFIIFTYFMVSSFIAAAKKRILYIEVFYGINPVTIRNISNNCEKLINKLKKDDHKKIGEEGLEEASDEAKSFLKKKNNLNESPSLNNSLNNSNEKKNNIKLSTNSKLFFIFYIIVNIAIYSYFPYNSYYLFNLCNKAINHSNFLIRTNHFQSSIIHVFNAYREYIFDNTSIIEGLPPFEYLIKRDIETTHDISDDIRKMTTYIIQNIYMDEEMIMLYSKDLCSYYITDSFKSKEECKNYFGTILNYDINIVMTNFLQKLRNIKNIVRYKHETEYIIGDLSSYDVEEWSKWSDDYFGEEYKDKNDKIKSFKLNLFNNDTLHSELNSMFINIFLPYLDDTRKLLVERLDINEGKKGFLINFMIYAIILFLLYLAFLIPMVKYINNFIYKTKNMLLLIPLSILVTQSNIKSSLKL